MTDQARGELVPGGLAMTHGMRTDINGKIVTTEKLITDGYVGEGSRVYRGNPCWLVRGPGLIVVIGGKGVPSSYAYISAKHLMPINPSADPISIDQRQECEA